jgi:hypothetical protein
MVHEFAGISGKGMTMADACTRPIGTNQNWPL